MKFNKALLEWYGVDPARVPDFEEFWALYATSFYERLFGKMSDPKEMEKVWKKYMNNPKLGKRGKMALTFFYNLRRDELEDPNYWDKVGNKTLDDIIKNESKKPMKAKLVRESLNEAWIDYARNRPYVNDDYEAEIVATIETEVSGEEAYDAMALPGAKEIVVDAYENGIDPEIVGQKILQLFYKAYPMEESLNESMSRYCDIYKTKDGKWYMDLANQEYGEYDDATTYGPFSSEEAADKYLRDNHSNPGGGWVDDSGEREVPTESPNGSRIVNPRSGGGGFRMGGYYGRRF